MSDPWEQADFKQPEKPYDFSEPIIEPPHAPTGEKVEPKKEK